MEIPFGPVPAAAHTPNLGATAGASVQIQNAIKLIEEALPALPIGSEAHKAVAGAISSLSKHFPAANTPPQLQETNLRDLQQHAQKTAMMQALLRSHLGGGESPGAPPAIPGA